MSESMTLILQEEHVRLQAEIVRRKEEVQAELASLKQMMEEQEEVFRSWPVGLKNC